MINSTFQVTFGIEVECVLAFHETLLRNHLATTDTEWKIIKEIPEDVRQRLNQVSPHYLRDDAIQHDTSRQMYMGWGLTTTTAYPPERDNIRFQQEMDMHLTDYGYRAYGGEILHVAHNILPKGVKIHDSFNSKNKYADFSYWHLTHERGLVGADKDDLMQQLDELSQAVAPDHLTNELKRPDLAKDWDTHPLELVSRVLPYNSASIDEVHQHLTALQGGLMHFAFVTKHCGLHVHVGLPAPTNHPAGTPPPTFTLPTLQHLAYIQVMYEPQISKLHPLSRGSGSNIDLKTNLDNFYEEPEMRTAEEEDALDARVAAGEDPDVVYGEQTPSFSFERAREKIFAPDMSVTRLSALMGGDDKMRIVNWLYITRTRGEARTLEFRQHEATLSPTAIAHWTAFVVGLVRLAEHNARIYGAEVGYGGDGYQCRELEEEGPSVWELMEGMELEEEEVGWWRGVVGGREESG